MEVSDAQMDMRHAYAGGAPGVGISGLVWVLAGLTCLAVSFHASMIFLFIGGMAIHPLSVLLSRYLERPGAARKGNAFTALALESTVILLAGFFLAYAVSHNYENWFFPFMLIAIGSRYFTFSTIYGDRTFWWLGGCLLLLAVSSMVWLSLSDYFVPIAGGVIELIFAAIIYNEDRAAAIRRRANVRMTRRSSDRA